MNDAAASIDAAVLARLAAVVGEAGVVADAADKARYLVDERKLYHGDAALVLRPSSTEQVAAVVRICAAAGIGIVPQGGNTGMVGGGVPRGRGGEVVLSLARMNRVREVDAIDYTMTVEAGCVLADVQRAAREAGRLFPLSLAAEGSCQIGGNLSTNAGGTAVLRYGNARELVLGLEVVLPDGEIWDGLRRLRKNNTGYDLKQLFLGAEGSLGIVTAAVLKLFPLPTDTCTALVALGDAHAAPRLLAALRELSGDRVSSFEYMQRGCMQLLEAEIEGARDPFAVPYEHYALVELAASEPDARLQQVMERALEEAFEAGTALDAVIAASGAQAEQLWHLREHIPEAQKRAGAGIKHDVSVPVSRVAEFIDEATRLSVARIPDARVIAFGHIGDGNIHFNLSVPEHGDGAHFLALGRDLTPRIHDLAVSLGGSFSAEHGIGQLKKDELLRYKSETELRLMRTIKHALDPANIMNPGKVID
ncbi:MAG: FAD-binding oxidoreductase [Gammaproteobacteria bacterium]|nr:FAD-binding oxidoreductase [Gammaproteobacteria bacterium]